MTVVHRIDCIAQNLSKLIGGTYSLVIAGTRKLVPVQRVSINVEAKYSLNIGIRMSMVPLKV